MPDLWTHVLCGLDSVEVLGGSRFKNYIENEIDLFKLGTLGGDIFYFYNFWPWLNSRGVVQIAEILHTRETGGFFINGIEYLKEKVSDVKAFRELFAYLAGFMCHFALDRNAHPFVYYFAGKYDKTKPETYKLKGYHKGLEAAIDTLLLYEKRGFKSYKYSAHREIDIKRVLPESIVDFYKHILSSLFDIDFKGGYLRGTYRDMVKTIKLLHDPIGIKVNILRFLEKVLAYKLEYSSIVYQKTNSSIDYMNKRKLHWVHPCDKDEIYNCSFYELYEAGVIDGCNMIEKTIEYIRVGLSREELGKAFPDLSYLTGKSIYDKNEIKYFKPIFR
jgi:hypothetical protein